ncbi:MAG: hypothetical protein HKN19_08825 [Halioglobus sp.]|nr:hypothetical protein [Halioglobus sp.]
MAEGIDQLREEQRRIVRRVFRIIAIGTAVGAVFFLYTEFVMTMEQTRQWLLSDVPRDEKVARALGEELPAGACEDVSVALDSARAERDAALESCHAEHASLASTAATSEEAFRTSLEALQGETTAQRKTIARRDAQIAALRDELAEASHQLDSYDETKVADAAEDEGTVGGLFKRLGGNRDSKRRFKVTAAKAYYDDEIGLSVSLKDFSGDYNAEVRIEAPGRGTTTDEMSPGEQHKFSHAGMHYTLVLLETDPKKGDVEFSLVGKPTP